MTSDSPEPMLTVELEDGEKATLAALLKQTIAADPFPLSQRVRLLRAILEKLEPPTAQPQPKGIGS